MVLFFIKKVFFDTWDNLLTIVLFNIGFSIIIAGSSYIAFLFEPAGPGYFTTVIVAVFIFNFYGAAVSGYMNELLRDNRPELKQIPELLKKILEICSSYIWCQYLSDCRLNNRFPFLFFYWWITWTCRSCYTLLDFCFMVGCCTVFFTSFFSTGNKRKKTV